MRVMAQMAMVMNLDKCIGCHTCSVTCKQAWTNRSGVEYVWFNNVESRPGQGYPRTYQDQEQWQGGWVRTRTGRLKPRAGGRIKKLLDHLRQPEAAGHGRTTTSRGPTTTSTCSPHRPATDTPVARPKSLLTGKDTKVTWSANWDDSLAGGNEIAAGDPILRPDLRTGAAGVREGVPVLPAPHLRALPQPVLRRVVPVRGDLQAGRGRHRAGRPGPLPRLADVRHRLPVQEDLLQPPHRQGREVHVLLPAHRDRPAHHLLGDLRRPAALHRADALRRRPGRRRRPRSRTSTSCTRRRRSVFLDPNDPHVVAAARAAGIPEDWISAAQRSPIWDLIMKYEVALPLHPEYRTMPMVWYIPPLSPVVDILRDTGHDGEDVDNLFGAVDALRIPVDYLAGLFTAGDPAPVTAVLRRLAAMRAYQRRINLGEERDESIAAAVGMTGAADGRHVPAAGHRQVRGPLRHPGRARRGRPPPRAARHRVQPRLRGRPGHGRRSGPFGESSGTPAPIDVENFHMLRDRQTADSSAAPDDKAGPGQPAQLGRQGPTRRTVPAEKDGAVTATVTDGRPGGAVAARAASLLLRYPDGEVLAALPTLTRGARRAARPRWPSRCGRSPSTGAGTDPARLRRRVRRAVRPPPPLLPAPDLLHRRRHPQARRGAGRCSPPRTRPPGCEVVDGELPDYLPAVLDLAAASTTAAGGCCARTASAWTCWPRPWPPRSPSTGTPSRRSGRCCRRRSPATSPPPSAWPAPARRSSRSAWNRSALVDTTGGRR